MSAVDQPLRAGPLVRRALLLRCPLCGHHPVVRRWFHMDEVCGGCGLRFERIVGHWFGPLALNTVVSFGALLIVVLGSFLLSWPEAPPTWVVAVGLGVAIGVPLVFLPWSRTLWLAFDLRVRPLADDEAPGRPVPSPRELRTGRPPRPRRPPPARGA